MASSISLKNIPVLANTIRPRLQGLRDYAHNIWVEMLLNGLGFVSGILVARWLGPSGRGQLAAAMLWPGVIGVVISLGLQQAFVYAVGVGWATPERLQRLGFRFTLFVAVPVMGLYWLVCPWILGKQFPNETWVPAIFSLSIPLAVYAGFLFPIYQGSGDFTRWNIARVFRSGAWTLALIGLAIVARLTVLNLLLVQILILLFLCGFLYAKLKTLKGRNRDEGAAPARLIFKYGFAIYLSGLAYMVNQQLDQLLLSIWVSSSDLGQYAAAATMSSVILAIPSAMGSIGFSKIARASEHPSEQRRHVRFTFLWSALFLVPAGLSLMILAPWVTSILYGPAFVHTAQLLRILAPAAISLGMGMVLNDVLRGLGKPMYVTYGVMAGATVTVLGLSFLLRTFGTVGAAWVSFAAYTTMMLTQCYFLWRLMVKDDPERKHWTMSHLVEELKEIVLVRRLREIKKHAVRAILPDYEHVGENYYATVSAFPMSYSVGRSIIEFCDEMKIRPESSRILIVGAHGGRDFNWLTGFRYQVDIMDLGHHEWEKSKYIGDACRPETWKQIEEAYDLIIMHDVLEHLPEDFAALCHARTVLKSDGFLFLSVPYKHDPEITHVRSYSEVTLNRLLGLAGYNSIWKRDRPGLLEAFPRLMNFLNYGLVVLMPSPRLGGRFLGGLLRTEYSINDKTRRLYRRFGRSPQKGVTLAAMRTADESLRSHVDINKEMFIA